MYRSHGAPPGEQDYILKKSNHVDWMHGKSIASVGA